MLPPGSESRRNDLPPDPTGRWWLLRGSQEHTVLEPLVIDVTTFRTRGDESRGQEDVLSVSRLEDPGDGALGDRAGLRGVR